MSKFKVGDIIVGTTPQDDVYRYTTEDAVMKVVENTNEWLIRVEILSHKTYRNLVEDWFEVEAEFFKLRKPVSLENK